MTGQRLVPLPLAWALAAIVCLPVMVFGQPTVKREAARPAQSVEGPALYKQYCAVCHGVDGKGNGPAAPALKVPPSDLTTYAQRNGGKFSEMDLRTVIGGDRSIAAHGTKDMPIWGEVFTVVMQDQAFRELRMTNLIRYLESIQAK